MIQTFLDSHRVCNFTLKHFQRSHQIHTTYCKIENICQKVTISEIQNYNCFFKFVLFPTLRAKLLCPLRNKTPCVSNICFFRDQNRVKSYKIQGHNSTNHQLQLIPIDSPFKTQPHHLLNRPCQLVLRYVISQRAFLLKIFPQSTHSILNIMVFIDSEL